MSMVEMAVALGVTLLVAGASSAHINAQFAVMRRFEEMRFYAAEAPRCSRALHRLSSGAATLSIHGAVGGAPAESGGVLRVSGGGASGWIYAETDPRWGGAIYFQPDAGGAAARWVVARNVGGLSFSFGPGLRDMVEVRVGSPSGRLASFYLERI